VTALPEVDLETLGFDQGAHLLVRLALEGVEPGAAIQVRGTHADLERHLRTWCRQVGHPEPRPHAAGWRVERGSASAGRWRGAVTAGGVGSDEVVEHPSADWSFAPRGAAVEAGGRSVMFSLDRKLEVWAEQAPRLYAQAAAHQWDPQSAIDWAAPITHDDDIEDAVVRVMAYLIENEEAALVVPARFLGRVHPHFREIQQVLAVQVADEARHIEVFTRRANLRRPMRALSTVGGRRSLQTLLEEPEFAIATFLLSVLGEGTFLSLLAFLEHHAPDLVTRQIAHLTRQDEARHVAFAMAHLQRLLSLEPSWRPRLAAAVERRYDALASTAGLNEEVFDALVVLAAGTQTPTAIAQGWSRVHELQREMHESRRMRLTRLGFSADEAERLSGLHTRNFM
jgi:hypothetical protein